MGGRVDGWLFGGAVEAFEEQLVMAVSCGREQTFFSGRNFRGSLSRIPPANNANDFRDFFRPTSLHFSAIDAGSRYANGSVTFNRGK